MPDTIEAAPQPAVTPVTQNSGAKDNGPANPSGQQLAQQFFKREMASVEAAPAEGEKAAETKSLETAETPAATGEVQVDPAEAAVETPAEVKAPEETPAEADEALSPETKPLDPKLQEAINKRIGKEAEKTRLAKEETERLRAELETLKSSRVEPEPEKPTIATLPSGAPPLANINDLNSLAQVQQQAKVAVRWAEEQLDREDFDMNPPINDGGQPFTKSQIRTAMRNAKVVLEDHIPQRAQFLSQKQQVDVLASQEFPWLKDKSSVEAQHAQQIMRERPWLNSVPERDWLLGVHIEGLKAIEARKEAAKKATQKPVVTAKPRPANSQTSVSADTTATRVPVTTQVKQQMQAASAKLKEKGSVTGKEYAAHLALQSQLRNTR